MILFYITDYMGLFYVTDYMAQSYNRDYMGLSTSDTKGDSSTT